MEAEWTPGEARTKKAHARRETDRGYAGTETIAAAV